MKMLYTPAPFLGIEAFRVPPIEVEVLEIDFEQRRARVLQSIGENSIVNILRRKEGRPPLLSTFERWVDKSCLRPV